MERMTHAIVKVEQESGVIALRLDFSGLIGEFLAAQDIRELSKTVYRKGLERFLNWLQTNGITQPDRQNILAFKVYLQESGLSANTVNSYLIGVRRFFAYLESMRLYPDVAKTIKGMTQPKTRREAPTIDQVKEILSQIDISTLIGKRNFAMILLMAKNGLRTCEVIRANVGDLNLAGGEAVLWIQGKGKDEKDDPGVVVGETLRAIMNYLQARGAVNPEDPLFVSHSDRNRNGRLTTMTVRTTAKFYLRKIGIDNKNISAHSLRHFFVTDQIRNGATLIQAQASARHASPDTTMGYFHDLDRISNAGERYVSQLTNL